MYAAGLRLDERFRQLSWRRNGSRKPPASPLRPSGLPRNHRPWPALPLIFRELKNNGGWWYPALRALTGANPVPESAHGDQPSNSESWLRWAQENGYA